MGFYVTEDFAAAIQACQRVIDLGPGIVSNEMVAGVPRLEQVVVEQIQLVTPVETGALRASTHASAVVSGFRMDVTVYQGAENRYGHPYLEDVVAGLGPMAPNPGSGKQALYNPGPLYGPVRRNKRAHRANDYPMRARPFIERAARDEALNIAKNAQVKIVGVFA